MRLITAAAILLLGMTSAAYINDAGGEELSSSDLFKIAYRSQKAERSRLTTWRGQLTCIEKSHCTILPTHLQQQLRPGKEATLRKIHFSSEFAVDLVAGKLLSSFEPVDKVEFLGLDDEIVASVAGDAFENRSLFLQDRTWTLRPWQLSGGREGDPMTIGWRAEKSRVVEAASLDLTKARVPYGDVVDPRQLFDPPGYDFLELLRLLSETDDQELLAGLKLRREANSFGERLVWESGSHLPGRYYTVYSVDPSVGYMLVQYTLYDRELSKAVEQIDIEFTKSAGVFVPARYSIWKLSGDGARLEISREYNVNESTVNTEIDESMFSLRQLGVQPGDRVVDSERRQLSIVGSDLEAVSVLEFEKAYAGGFDSHGGGVAGDECSNPQSEPQ